MVQLRVRTGVVTVHAPLGRGLVVEVEADGRMIVAAVAARRRIRIRDASVLSGQMRRQSRPRIPVR